MQAQLAMPRQPDKLSVQANLNAARHQPILDHIESNLGLALTVLEHKLRAHYDGTGV